MGRAVWLGADELDWRLRAWRQKDFMPMRRGIAQHFDATVDQGFANDGTIREKYNVVSRNANVQVSTGYKQNVIGFGWTNAVYLKNEGDG